MVIKFRDFCVNTLSISILWNEVVEKFDFVNIDNNFAKSLKSSFAKFESESHDLKYDTESW